MLNSTSFYVLFLSPLNANFNIFKSQDYQYVFYIQNPHEPSMFCFLCPWTSKVTVPSDAPANNDFRDSSWCNKTITAILQVCAGICLAGNNYYVGRPLFTAAIPNTLGCMEYNMPIRGENTIQHHLAT